MEVVLLTTVATWGWMDGSTALSSHQGFNFPLLKRSERDLVHGPYGAKLEIGRRVR